jgi:hypothetical protein
MPSKERCRYCGMVVGPAEVKTVDHGVAEILGALGLPAAAAAVVAGASSIAAASSGFVVEGKTYASLEDMPPDVRRRVEEKMARLAALGFALPTR